MASAGLDTGTERMDGGHFQSNVSLADNFAGYFRRAGKRGAERQVYGGMLMSGGKLHDDGTFDAVLSVSRYGPPHPLRKRSGRILVNNFEPLIPFDGHALIDGRLSRLS